MTKIAILGDTHIGAKNDDLNVYENMREFFQGLFFPTLKERGIEHVIHMGDVFDRRKYLNTHIFKMARADIFEPLNRFNVHVVLGNHDCVKTSTNFPNTSVFLEDYDNIIYVERPQTVSITDDFEPLMLPWINKENFQETMDVIKKSKAMFAFGHLEITGFEYHAGTMCKHGLSPSIFKKFAKVYSGHFHKKSEGNVINYVGTPYQTSMHELTERKGFHIFDTETHEMEFIENTNRLYVEITDDWTGEESLKGKYVRVAISEEKSKSPEYDILKSKIEEQGVIKVSTRITERVELKEEVVIDDEAIDDMNIVTISNEYIDKLDYTRKEDLKDLITTLHKLASASA